MRVRCISDYVTEQQRASLGRSLYQGAREWGLTIGEEYLVLGLTFEADPKHATTGPFVHLLLQQGDVLNVRTYDLCLFTITDPRASRYWEVRSREFDGRQIVDVLPLVLADGLYSDYDLGTTNTDGSEEDDKWFAFLDSDEFRQLCDFLRDENADE